MATLYLCGAGNPEGVRLALAVNRKDQRWSEIVLLDDDHALHGKSILGVKIVGSFDLLAQAASDSSAVNLVARSTRGRAASRDRILRHGVPLVPLIHPQVDVLGVELEGDVTVYANAVASAGSRIGAGSVVFTGAVVGHGSTIGRGCVLAPGAVTSARVVVGEAAYLGTNCSVLPELNIGAGATVSAGSAVMTEVPPGVTMMGVPAEALGARSARVPGVPSSTEPSAETLELVAHIWGARRAWLSNSWLWSKIERASNSRSPTSFASRRSTTWRRSSRARAPLR
jgi:acetyltransferase-like isoleucine patch superfamily enzyme